MAQRNACLALVALLGALVSSPSARADDSFNFANPQSASGRGQSFEMKRTARPSLPMNAEPASPAGERSSERVWSGFYGGVHGGGAFNPNGSNP